MVDTRIVGVLLFEDVEVLDFAGPFEVFGVAGYASGLRCADVFTVAQRRSPVLARSRISIRARGMSAARWRSSGESRALRELSARPSASRTVGTPMT